MPISQPFAIGTDDGLDVLARIREEASALSFSPRGTVRCEGRPLFRHRAARDFGCLLDLDPSVISWTCLPMILHHAQGVHVPDFAVTRTSGTTLIDVLPPNREPCPPPLLAEAALAAGHRYETVTEADIPEGFRLDNARDLLRYANHHVSLGDRVRLLTLLDERGPMPLAACMQVIRDGRDPIGTIAAMALRRFVEIDLDEARIGPETRVSRLHD
ncbi:hypothetical protein DC522_13000 [Microvirga sp. KLBC 81]|uniref:hypothetical protein n=1 Tax=Microvirga sp. KLBC 81 TaxID=1862707 RepID=UPI000D50DADB|nr:hypothetical protein [Microvirga sp. KLBC 81]PVE24015.1 hypothetical protein DC522_13000 [Microvirga sp. KLBC 81]